MKFNSILLIIFCLLQSLIYSAVELNEQSLIDSTNKILKYANIYHEEYMKLEDKQFLHDWQMYCPKPNLNNIQFKFDENGNLHMKFVNLKIVVSGKYRYGLVFSEGSNGFTANLDNFDWEEIFEVSKTELEDGKLDIQFKLAAELAFNYNINLLGKYAINVEMGDLSVSLSLVDNLKDLLKKNISFNALKNQFKKVSSLILQTFKSDLQ